VPEPVELLWRLRQEGLDVPLGALDVEECAQTLMKALTGKSA
jgi:energy-coupling factor transport system ATP-binding protein